MSANIYQKLLAVRKGIPGLAKDSQTQSAGRFKYVSSNNILGTIRPLLDEQGLVLECRVLTHNLIDKWRGIADQKEHLTELFVEFVWVNADAPEERIPCSFYGQGLDTGEKGVGKALTYAEKYFLLKFFQIPTDDDDPDAGHSSNGNGRASRFETPASDIAAAQYHQDGRPANAAAERHAHGYSLAPAAEEKLLTLMDALEMADSERAEAWATVTSRENAVALKADLERQLAQKREAVA